MTIGIHSEAVLDFIGNDTASAFPVSFRTFEKETIEVSVADSDGLTTALDVDTHFTISNYGKINQDAVVTLLSTGDSWLTGNKLKTGWTLFIKFAATGYQPMKGRDIIGPFAPEKLESTLDRLAMSILAVKALASKALGLQLGDGADASLPPLSGNEDRILKVNSDADGFEYGPTVDEVEQWSADAVAAKNDALTYRNSAITARDSAENARDLALTYRNQASASAVTASSKATDAIQSAINAGLSADQANTAAQGAQTAKTAAESARDLAQSYSLDASAATAEKLAAQAARNLAEQYKDDALAFRNTAETHKNNAAASAVAAGTSATNAATSATTSHTYRDEAQTFRNESEDFRNDAQLFGSLLAFKKKINISFADSPFTIDDDLHEDTLILVDDTGGNVILNMPAVSDTIDQIAWKVGVLKQNANLNNITINRVGTDNINGSPSLQVADPSVGAVLYAETPFDWAGKYLLSAVAADSFVVGGATLNLGDPTVDGSFRFRPAGGQLFIEKRVAGLWEERDIIN